MIDAEVKLAAKAPYGEKPVGPFLSGVSPKKVPPLLLQPPTLNHTLNHPASPLGASPKLRASAADPPVRGSFLTLPNL